MRIARILRVFSVLIVLTTPVRVAFADTAPPWLAVNESAFPGVVLVGSQRHAVIVEFYAEWCGYCRKQLPLLESLAREFDTRVQLVRVDVDANQSLATQLRVKGLPTVIVYRYGMALNRIEGAGPEHRLRSLFEHYGATPEFAPSRITFK